MNLYLGTPKVFVNSGPTWPDEGENRRLVPGGVRSVEAIFGLPCPPIVICLRRTSCAAFAVCGAVLAGCGQQPGASVVRTDPVAVAKLRRVDPDANRLIGGGLDEFRRRLRAARGQPMVVNQWASWCGPCRFEFPFLQRQALRLRGRVRFLGVNSNDSSSDARKFLAQYPTPFPHIEDPKSVIARSFGGGRAWPTTAFYDAKGRVAFVHQGAYASEARLAQDIRRYALRG